MFVVDRTNCDAFCELDGPGWMRPSGPGGANRAHCLVSCHHNVIKLFSCTPGNPKESASSLCLSHVRGLVFVIVFAMIHGLCVAVCAQEVEQSISLPVDVPRSRSLSCIDAKSVKRHIWHICVRTNSRIPLRPIYLATDTPGGINLKVITSPSPTRRSRF